MPTARDDQAPDPVENPEALSIVSGPPLEDESGVGALTLPGFLREVTTAYRDREALVLHEGDTVTRWTYGELWDQAMAVARALRAAGSGHGARVGVLMTNRPEWLAAVFGVSLTGGVPVALSTFSTPRELEDMLQSSAVGTLIFEREVLTTDFAAMLTDLEPAFRNGTPGALQSQRFPQLRRLVVLGDPVETRGFETWDAFLDSGRNESDALIEAMADAVQPSDTAIILFSSGSTSRPKGIRSAHRAVSLQLWRFPRLYGFTPEDRVRSWVANGLFWSGNIGMAIGTTIGCGGCLILQRSFDAAEALELIERERVSFPFAWPHQWQQLASASNWDRVDVSSIRYADGEICSLAKHPTFKGRRDWREPNRAYGNTETFTLSTAYMVDTPESEHRNSHGLVLPGNTLKIVDPTSGRILPRGERGEICVKGPTLMLGYLGTPLMDSVDRDGFFATGDGGFFDGDGRLFWEGRLSDVIKTGGANVSPSEVDAVTLELPGVKIARAVGVPHETLGEIVVSCIVPQAGAALDEDGVRAFLRERLARYKVPRRILFLTEDELSLTGTAKIKTNELRDWAAQRLSAEEDSA